jgi:hypothetical protein
LRLISRSAFTVAICEVEELARLRHRGELLAMFIRTYDSPHASAIFCVRRGEVPMYPTSTSAVPHGRDFDASQQAAGDAFLICWISAGVLSGDAGRIELGVVVELVVFDDPQREAAAP